MKIGLFTDSLHDLSFTNALDWCVSNGIETVEIGTGNFSPAPHCDLVALLNDENARAEFKAAIESRGLTLSAINCNGNQLDPHPERRKTHEDTFFKTIEAASNLGLDTVVAMSGCPGDRDGGTTPNWVIHPSSRPLPISWHGNGTKSSRPSGSGLASLLPTTASGSQLKCTLGRSFTTRRHSCGCGRLAGQILALTWTRATCSIRAWIHLSSSEHSAKDSYSTSTPRMLFLIRKRWRSQGAWIHDR